MTDTTTFAPNAGAAAPRNLAERVIGVVVSPGDTYESVVARPRALGVLVLVALVVGVTSFAFLSTDVGQNALLDQQVRFMEAFGANIPDEAYEMMESRANMQRYFALIGTFIMVPLGAAIVAGLALLVFNAVLGGDATFKQVFAVVAHAEILIALQTLFVTPLNYARETMSSATNLAVFLPMLDETGFAARLLGWIDLFRIWWLVSLAIGLGVLYKRKAAPIGWSLLAVYLGFALVIAAVMTAIAGA